MSIRSLAEVDSSNLSFDIVIVGSGPAGLAIAMEFLSTSLNIAVLESGGEGYDEATDALNEFDSVGHVRAPHNAVGRRGFGGSSALWTGRCGQLDAIDYHARPWIPFSGWPIDAESLEQFYLRAATFLGLCAPRSADTGQRDLHQPFDKPGHDASAFKPVLWQFSTSVGSADPEVRSFTPHGSSPDALLQHTGAPTAIHAGQRCRSALDASRNVHIFTNATVTEIRTDQVGGAVSGVRVLAPNGTTVEIHAPRVVLACGGVQNARLLLASRDQKPLGLGNDHDQVGRYLSDHTFTELATFRGSAGTKLRRRLGTRWHPQFGKQHVHTLGLRLSEEKQRELGLLNAAIFTVEYGARLNALSALARGGRSLKGRSFRSAFHDLVDAASHPINLVEGFQDRYVARRPSLNFPDQTVVGCVVEQELQPESRVTLSERKDHLGQPVAQLDWRISDREYRTACAVESLFRAEVSRLDLGAYERPAWTQGSFNDWSDGLIDLAHPSCTTRMSHDPATGVVDSNCNVFRVRGLYIAGSSVFASNSHMNPTHTLVSLALRLADHLKSGLRASVPAMPRSAELRPLRLGFIGGGHRVETIHAPVMAALRSEVEVCGVFTRSTDRAARISALTGWPAVTDLQELTTAGKPDLLVVAVPNESIDATYSQIVDLGIPLLLETPFCWNETAGRKLLKKIEQRRLLVGVAEQFPFMPEAKLVQKLLSVGLLGQVKTVMNDLGIYDYHGMALLKAYLGGARRPMTAQAVRLDVGPAEQCLLGSIAFEDGCSIVHRYPTCYPTPAHREKGTIRVYGNKGTLSHDAVQFEDREGEILISRIQRRESGEELRSIFVKTPDGELEWENPFLGSGLDDEKVAVATLVRSMVKAIRHSGAPAYPPSVALEDVELMNALGYSADRGGTTVSLPASQLRQKALKRLRKLRKGSVVL